LQQKLDDTIFFILKFLSEHLKVPPNVIPQTLCDLIEAIFVLAIELVEPDIELLRL